MAQGGPLLPHAPSVASLPSRKQVPPSRARGRLWLASRTIRERSRCGARPAPSERVRVCRGGIPSSAVERTAGEVERGGVSTSPDAVPVVSGCRDRGGADSRGDRRGDRGGDCELQLVCEPPRVIGPSSGVGSGDSDGVGVGVGGGRLWPVSRYADSLLSRDVFSGWQGVVQSSGHQPAGRHGQRADGGGRARRTARRPKGGQSGSGQVGAGR